MEKSQNMSKESCAFECVSASWQLNPQGQGASSKAEWTPHTSKEPGVAELKKSQLQAGLGTRKAIQAAGLGLTC